MGLGIKRTAVQGHFRFPEISQVSKGIRAHSINTSTWESHICNPRTRKVETGINLAGQTEVYKEASKPFQSGDDKKLISPFWPEDSVEVSRLPNRWLFYFSDFSSFT